MSASVMNGEIAISWTSNGLIGRVALDGRHWASVEWSEKRQRWCIEDCEGRCLKHVASIRGQAASRDEAIALAEAMIRDGRMPSPERARAEADERRRVARDKRARQPAQQARQARREAEMEAFRRKMRADRREWEQPPIYEALNEAFDLADPELWKSNSFAALRPRLIVHLEAAIAELEWNKHAHDREARLERAKAILAVLTRRADVTSPPCEGAK
jgi:hypothetical protein